MGSRCRFLVLRRPGHTMTSAPLRLLLVCVLVFGIVNCQRNRNRNNNRNNRNNRRNNRRNNGGGVTRNGSRDRAGTEVYPGCDGKVCLPEAKLCAVRKKRTDTPPLTDKTTG